MSNIPAINESLKKDVARAPVYETSPSAFEADVGDYRKMVAANDDRATMIYASKKSIVFEALKEGTYLGVIAAFLEPVGELLMQAWTQGALFGRKQHFMFDMKEFKRNVSFWTTFWVAGGAVIGAVSAINHNRQVNTFAETIKAERAKNAASAPHSK